MINLMSMLDDIKEEAQRTEADEIEDRERIVRMRGYELYELRHGRLPITFNLFTTKEQELSLSDEIVAEADRLEEEDKEKESKEEEKIAEMLRRIKQED